VPKESGLAPDFTLLDLSGREVSLSDLKDHKVMLHFFATWCGVCKVELSSMRGLHENLDEDELVVAIAADGDDVEALRRFASEHDLEYPILRGTPDVLAAYGVDSFPTNYYLNGEGTVSASSVGLSTRLGMAFRLAATDSR
jgi:peroxiredoxin